MQRGCCVEACCDVQGPCKIDRKVGIGDNPRGCIHFDMDPYTSAEVYDRR